MYDGIFELWALIAHDTHYYIIDLLTLISDLLTVLYHKYTVINIQYLVVDWLSKA